MLIVHDTYHLIENGKKTGPFTALHLSERIKAGEVFSETVCIPTSPLGEQSLLSNFFPNTTQGPVDASTRLETDMETGMLPPQNNGKISKIEYLGMGVCAILIFTGTNESIFFGIFLIGLFFGKRIYRAAIYANSGFGINTTPKTTESNCEKTKAPTTSKEITKKLSNASKELAKEMQRKLNEAINFSEKKKKYIDSIKSRSTCNPVEVVVLGGAGWENKKDNTFMLSMDASIIYMSDLKTLIDTSINIDGLREIEISGPGKVTSDAGVIGGGFGPEGALKGIAIATVINILTTHSNTKTFIRLGFQNSEIVMLTSKIEPDKARILLSPLFLKVNRKPTEEKTLGVSDEIHKLHELKQNGAITDLEFEKLKNKLIG